MPTKKSDERPSIETPKGKRKGSQGLRSGTRILRNDGPGRVIARFQSYKMGEPVSVDSGLEFDQCFRYDFDRSILKFHAQPLLLRYPHYGRKLQTTPDFLVERVTDSGTAELALVEVKPDSKAQDEEFQDKVASRSIAAAELGFRYEVVTDAEIRIQPALWNLKLIHHYARFGWKVGTITLLGRIDLPATFRELEEQLNQSDLNIGAVFAAIQRGDLVVNMTERITALTTVAAARP